MTHTELKQRAFANPQVREEYDRLAPQYELIRAVIAARLEQGLTQTELARRVGTKQNNISRFESGAHVPTLEFAGKLADALGKKLHISLL
jgi:ribosome-binding protein aMBF1 (putative translation factor)